MKRLALVVAVASFSAFAGEPTQPPTTTAPVAKKKSLSTEELKNVGIGPIGSGTSSGFGTGSLGTRGSGTSTKSAKTTTPTK